VSPRKSSKSDDSAQGSVPPPARWVEEANSFDQPPQPVDAEPPTEVAWQEPSVPLSTPAVPDALPEEPWAAPDVPPPVVPAPVVKRSRAKKPEPEPEPEAEDVPVESDANAMDSPETPAASIEQEPAPFLAAADLPVESDANAMDSPEAPAAPIEELPAPSGLATLSAEHPEALIAAAFIAGSVLATTIKRLGR
jgi:hypothetical protein